MKKRIQLLLFALAPLAALAHPGHPGPADHGTLAHLLLGTAIALPLAGIAAWTLRTLSKRPTLLEAPNRKDPSHGQN